METSPIRMCLSCRKRALKRELVRLVWKEDKVLHDKAQRMPGRGCYVHPESDCLSGLIRKDRIWRALKLGKKDFGQQAAYQFTQLLLKSLRL